MERDFHRALPHATVVTARMLLRTVEADEEEAMLREHAPAAAERIGTAAPDVVVFGCTSASALLDERGERRLCRQLEVAAGAPAISLIAAVRDAVRRRAPRAVAVFTPYVDNLTRPVAASIEAAGTAVVSSVGLGIADNRRIGEINPDDLVGLAREHVRTDGADLVFVSCTNLCALEARDALEAALGVPVLTSNQAALEEVEIRLQA
jgi:maleate isomerase